MDVGLATILIAIGSSLLVSTGVIITNTIIKTQNTKLKVDVNNLTNKLDMETLKNIELTETLDYIRSTGKIPQKVLENKYEFQNTKVQTASEKISSLKNKFKTKTNLSEEKDLSKEDIEKYIAMQNMNKDQDKNQNK